VNNQKRIEQLILLISYARKHQGTKTAQLAQAMGVPADELRHSIDTLNLCGRPPFNPDDLIEIWVDASDRVQVQLDQSLGRPLQLTPQESLALSIALRTLANAGAGPLGDLAASALSKVRAILSESARGGDRLAQQFAVEVEDRDHEARFRTLAEAFERRRAVEIVYFTASRSEVTRRVVQPYALIQFLGAWYAVGHDSLRGEVRIFKVERVREASLTDVSFVIPSDFDAKKYADSQMLVGAVRSARLRFGPPWVQTIRDEWPESVEPQSDGGIVLTLDYGNVEWAAGWALSYAPHVEVLEPAELREAFVAKARAALARY
jgi:proteasome accessory factor C